MKGKVPLETPRVKKTKQVGATPLVRVHPSLVVFRKCSVPAPRSPPSVACRRPCKYLHQILPAYKKKNTKIIFSFLLPFLKVLTQFQPYRKVVRVAQKFSRYALPRFPKCCQCRCVVSLFFCLDIWMYMHRGLPCWLSYKESACQCRR